MAVIPNPYASDVSFATNAGTATIANALNDATGTVDVSASAAPGTLAVLTSQSRTAASWQPGMALGTSTGTAGYGLINNTATILAWVAPADGNLHRVMVISELSVATTQVSGSIAVAYTTPDGTQHTQTPYAGALTAGGHLPNPVIMVPVQAGATVTMYQSSAMSSGVATLWAEIWGS